MTEADRAAALADEISDGDGLTLTLLHKDARGERSLVADEMLIIKALRRLAAQTAPGTAPVSDWPLTARDLADVFGCVWDAAIGAAHQQQGGMDFACILAEAFGAMTTRLVEIAEKGQANDH